MTATRTDNVTTASTVRSRLPFLLEFYRSDVGKKWTMAVTGAIGLAYLLVHMLGNLKIFLGVDDINEYGEFLRDVGEPALPRSLLLWAVRVVVIAALALHLHAATVLTIKNRRARPGGYASPRDYIAAGYASRTMIWSGIIVGAFLIYHLMQFTWGNAHSDFERGEVYDNTVEAFRVWPISITYIAANLLLGLHIYHGAWSMFQSLGVNNPRFNPWRRWFAGGLTGVIVLGFISVPLAVMVGIVD